MANFRQRNGGSSASTTLSSPHRHEAEKKELLFFDATPLKRHAAPLLAGRCFRQRGREISWRVRGLAPKDSPCPLSLARRKS